MLRYSFILFKLVFVFTYLVINIVKKHIYEHFFCNCESFLWISEQIFKLSELENFDFERKIKIKGKVKCLEFENYQKAIMYIEQVSINLQVPISGNLAITDNRFQLYNCKLEQMREKASVWLNNYVKNDS